VWTEIPRIRARDCSCFRSNLSNDELGSFPKASELLGCGSEDNDSAPSPLLASSATIVRIASQHICCWTQKLSVYRDRPLVRRT
jgi:hypothetical protein